MFIFNEDRALHTKLSGLVVGGVNAPDQGAPVDVIWLNPDIELQDLTFPCIVISNSGLTYDSERAAAGWFQLPYTPENFAHWDTPEDVTTSPYWAQTPIPYNINYQIEVLARNNSQATFLAAVLSGPDFLNARFGYLDVPEDGTVRRLDLMSGPERQSIHDGDGKRLFHSVYALRVSTELLPKQIEAYSIVTDVVNTISLINPVV